MKKYISSLFASLFLLSSLHAAQEQTLAIIKPDAVAADHIGQIIARLEKNGLHVIALKMAHITKPQAEEFYAIHKERPFYKDLVTFMSSAPVVLIALEGENSVAKNREVIGATNPKEAAQGTIRADFARSLSENAIHGSDSVDNAKNEVAFFFSANELFPKK
ncbi:MAG: nucleoside-diphosphate kinase [Parachlamydiaceae bacterium]|nr:nucleoside-diphosphate kinase [Parachlamydiaceae bacterium]